MPPVNSIVHMSKVKPAKAAVLGFGLNTSPRHVQMLLLTLRVFLFLCAMVTCGHELFSS